MAKHYIAMAGMHGCLPNICESHESLTDAVGSMANLHALGRERRQALKREKYLELSLTRDGNEYVEITICICNNPEIHND